MNLEIAEREVVLTHALQLLSEAGGLEHPALQALPAVSLTHFWAAIYSLRGWVKHFTEEVEQGADVAGPQRDVCRQELNISDLMRYQPCLF